jgi:hypothetical protein
MRGWGGYGLRDWRRVALVTMVIFYSSFYAGCHCLKGESYSRPNLTASVRTSADAPVPEVLVTPYIIDVAQPADVRAPIVLEPRLTDAEGNVQWEYDSEEMPYFCGYEVTNVAETEILAAVDPERGRVMSTTDGHLWIRLP